MKIISTEDFKSAGIGGIGSAIATGFLRGRHVVFFGHPIAKHILIERAFVHGAIFPTVGKILNRIRINNNIFTSGKMNTYCEGALKYVLPVYLSMQYGIPLITAITFIGSAALAEYIVNEL